MFFDKNESCRIPPQGTILWASIPIRELESKTKAGYEKAITDKKRHRVTISPTEQWKTLKVTPGKIRVGEENTESEELE
ncbi:MAG: hypothetical protein M0R70_15395 [Nitrospirae bacterium]|nr:hypothetical protein [Nitrospirota bacterium]